MTVRFDAPRAAIDFAKTHIFAEHAAIPPRRPLTASVALDATLERLQAQGLTAGLQSFCFCGLTAWVSSPHAGGTAKSSLSSNSIAWRRDGSVADWMIHTAGIEEPAQGGLGRSLEAEIKRLHDQEVNAGFELLASSKELRVWIGDELNGVEKLAIVSPAEAADWLHRTAREMVR